MFFLYSVSVFKFRNNKHSCTSFNCLLSPRVVFVFQSTEFALAVFSGKGGHCFMIIGLWDIEFSKECLKSVALKDKFDLN